MFIHDAAEPLIINLITSLQGHIPRKIVSTLLLLPKLSHSSLLVLYRDHLIHVNAIRIPRFHTCRCRTHYHALHLLLPAACIMC